MTGIPWRQGQLRVAWMEVQPMGALAPEAPVVADAFEPHVPHEWSIFIHFLQGHDGDMSYDDEIIEIMVCKRICLLVNIQESY